MSAIPYDLLPDCDPKFACLKLKQKQSFVNRFFGIRSYDEAESNVKTSYPRNAARGLSSATTSRSTSYVSLNSKASTSSIRLPVATQRRPRSNTTDSCTSIASFVSQTSVHSNGSYQRLSSCSPNRKRTAILDDGWTTVDQYF